MVVLDENNIEDNLHNIMKAMQDAGYAIAVWTPKEIGSADPKAVEDAMIIAGSEYITYETGSAPCENMGEGDE